MGLLVYGVISVFGREEVVVEYVWPIVRFLGTGPGVLLSVSVAVLLLGVSRSRELPGGSRHVAPSSETDRDRVQLRSALREAERELERLRPELRKSDRKLEQLGSKLQEAERELERLKPELREGKRERERLKSELRESKRQCERLKSERQEGEQVLEWLRSDPQEDERLKAENEQLRAERDALKEKIKTQDRRITLKQALSSAYREGLHLRRRTPSHRRRNGGERAPSDEAAAKWAIRTNELIKEALGEGEARLFLGADGRRVGDSSATEEQKRLNDRLNRLSELIQRVDSLQPIELQPDFISNGSR